MGTLKTEKHFLVKLTFAKKDGSATKNIWISNRTFAAGQLYTASPEVIGILRAINGTGQEMGTVLPSVKTGSIQIDVTRGTYTYIMRLYDLLEEYVLNGQPVEIYAFQKPRETIGDAADLESEFVGVVTDYSISIAERQLSILITNKILSEQIVNGRVPDSVEGIPTEQDEPSVIYRRPVIEESNVGKALPIVFGNSVQVVPLVYFRSMSQYNATGDDLVVESGFGGIVGQSFNDTDNADVYSIQELQEDVYVAKGDGVFVAKKIPVDIGGDPDATDVDDPLSGTGAATQPLIATGVSTEFLIEIPQSFWPAGSEDYIWSAISCSTRGINDATYDATGQIHFGLAVVTWQGPNDNGVYIPTERFLDGARASLNKFDIQSQIRANVTAFLQGAYFEKPVIFDSLQDLYFWVKDVSQSYVGAEFRLTYDLTGGDYRTAARAAAVENPSTRTSQYGENAAWRDSQLAGGDDHSTVMRGFALWYWKQTEVDVFEDSFTYTRLETMIHSGSGKKGPASLVGRDLVMLVDGIEDVSGDFAGVGTTIKNALHVVKFLYFFQNGFSLTGFDEARFPDAEAAAPEIGAVWEKEITYRNMIADILQQTSSALIPNRDGSFSFWTYGVEQPIAAVLSERDCVLEEIVTLGIEEIVNSISLVYGERKAAVRISGLGAQYWDGALSDSDEESITAYGVRNAEADFVTVPMLRTAADAQRYIDYYLARYAHERMVFTLRVPYWRENYRGIELWDLVQLSHIDNPSKVGSLPPNQTRTINNPDEHDTSADWAMGFLLRHAKRYTFRVIGREPVMNVESGEEPEIVFKLLAMTNPNEIAIAV